MSQQQQPKTQQTDDELFAELEQICQHAIEVTDEIEGLDGLEQDEE